VLISPKNWNEEYLSRTNKKPHYDFWLDKHKDILEKWKVVPILDLGCGLGNDSLYLTERGYEVICCDISEKVISNVRETIPAACAMVVDMLDGLPFEDHYFNVVIADLCLHYFKWVDTVKIVNEISRVLKDDGFLLCRVNSTMDVHYGAGQGVPIEENYYYVNGDTKRFFDKQQLEALFKDWETKYICECQIDRYKLPKILWEFAVQK
jgi:SAM-dependent methyltransferase